jgi:aspartyl-tRNA(Asn)/glutamyl-tRNA(Gln) amidotransferase subunit A
MVAFASSLDQAGPLTHTVEDAALMLSVMASYDEKDATSSSQQVRNYDHNLSDNIKGLRIGLPKEYLENLTPETLAMVQNGIQWLKDAGAQIVEGVSLPLTQYALPVYYIIAPAEASSNLARYDGVRYGFRADHVNKLEELYERSRGEGFGQEVRRRILIGTYVLSSGYYDAYYVQAQKIRSLIQADFRRIFETVDVLLTPTTPNAAFPLNEPPKDPVTMYLNDIYTVTVNLAGLPAISVPAGYDKEGLPLGLQIIGSNFQEQRILNTAYAIEQRSGFKGL